MFAWSVAVVDGLLTGIGLYILVRIRMYLGPWAGQHLGKWGRRAVWLVLIAAMVVVAELDLAWLRNWLDETNAPGIRFYYEAVYATTLLTVGLALVRSRVLRLPAKPDKHMNRARSSQ